MIIKQTFTLICFLILLMMSSYGHAVERFSDLSGDDWSWPYIAELTETGAIRGYSDGTFRPDTTITREHSLLILERTLDVTDAETDHRFSDVTPDMDGYSAIHTMAALGVIETDELFHPHRPLTRAEMAKLLVGTYDLEGSSINSYSDTDGHWGEAYIRILTANGITEGFPDGSFRPDASVTREQMAAFIVRALSPGHKEYMEEIIEGILFYTNEARRSEGLSPLERHEELEAVAMVKAQDLYENDFDHVSPVYGDPFEMMTNAGIAYSYAGENIAAGMRSAEDAVEAWMNSEGHRENILEPAFTHLGVGYYEVETSGRTETYFVQMFVTPQ